MSIAELLSKPEFWSALFGALAAFLLGALGTWWANVRAKRTAGNLALIALSQMYGLMENLRYQLLVQEPIRARKVIGRDPWSHEIRPSVGLPDPPPRMRLEDLGFLVDSYDPDVLNRLLTIERAFLSMLYLVRRHEALHTKFQETLNAIDRTAQTPLTGRDLVELVGAKLLIEIKTTVEELEKGLPETRDMTLSVAKQLRSVLRAQIPIGRVIRFTPAPRSRLADEVPGLPSAARWRRLIRFSYDQLLKPRTICASKELLAEAEPEPTPPADQESFAKGRGLRRSPVRTRVARGCYHAATVLRRRSMISTIESMSYESEAVPRYQFPVVIVCAGLESVAPRPR